MTPVLLHLTDSGEGRAAMIKDTIDVAGVPTRGGSRALRDAPAASQDAEVVALLRRAGWRITGKTKLHELAFGVTGINRHEGTPTNPRWPDLVPGGSSSGSAAAVAAGLVPLALGTDTGGSVRIPAACCGVFGLKPTFGLVSRKGVMPAHTTLDCVGPLAADMATLVDAMKAMAPGFVLADCPASIKVGLLAVDAAPAVQARVASALQAWRDQDGIDIVRCSSPSFKDAFEAGLSVINAETWAACRDLVETGLVGADIVARLSKAKETTPVMLEVAESVRARFSGEIDALLADVTVLALPTMAALPPRVADAADTSAAVGMTSLVRPFNLSGHPAITLPLNTDGDGPVALQLVAAHGADGLLCAVAQAATAALSLKSTAP